MELQFCLSEYSDVQTKNMWKSLKESCENGNIKPIVEEWLQSCELEYNKNAIFMNTLDGGIMLPNKNMIRFRYSFDGLQTDDNIILNYFIVDDILTHVDETIHSMTDLVNGFIIMSNKRMGGNYVRGNIKMSKTDIPDYSSDSE
jgi:hypothetical protein